MIALSGFVWMAVGLFLLPLGLRLLAEPSINGSYPLISLMSPYFGGRESASVVLIAMGLLVGYTKSRKVLTKVVKKTTDRILALPNPSPITALFGVKYLLLIGAMISMGMMIKFFDLPNDIRGVVDVAVGSALLNGGMAYLHNAYASYQLKNSQL